MCVHKGGQSLLFQVPSRFTDWICLGELFFGNETLQASYLWLLFMRSLHFKWSSLLHIEINIGWTLPFYCEETSDFVMSQITSFRIIVMVYRVYLCRPAKQHLKLQGVKSNKWEKSQKKDLFGMAPIPFEIQGMSPEDESTSSEISIRSPLWEYTIPRELVLRPMIQEDAIQGLSTESVIKKLHIFFL